MRKPRSWGMRSPLPARKVTGETALAGDPRNRRRRRFAAPPMRPHRLALCAIGPFASEVEVNFDSLVSEGLFLIHGPTGAGKTFLLDAVCYALYGHVPGVRRPDTLHSDHAAAGASPWAELEFTSQGSRWRVRRIPKHERAKKRGDGTTLVQAAATLERHQSGAWHHVAAKPRDVNDIVSDLLGLSAVQFQQVILLPQGQFERVLRCTSEDRESLLRTLFDTGIFERATTWLAAEARRRQDEAKEQEVKLANLHRQAVDRWRSVAATAGVDPPLVAPDDESCPADQAAFDDLVEDARFLAVSAAASAVAADEALNAARVTKTATERTAEQWDRRASLLKRRAELDEAQDEIDATRETLDLADAAEAFRQILTDEQRVRTKIERLTPLVDEHAATLNQSLQQAQSLPHDLERPAEEAVPSTDELQEMRNSLAAHHTELERHASDANQASKLEASAADQSRELADLKEQIAIAETEWGSARKRHLESREALLQLRERHLEGIAAELASSLHDGGPCPVCGSTEHPSLAEPADDAVVPSQVAAAEDEVTAAEALETEVNGKKQNLANKAAALESKVHATTSQAAGLRAAILETIGEVAPDSAINDLKAVDAAAAEMQSAAQKTSEAATAHTALTGTLAEQLASSPFSAPGAARAALRSAAERDEARRHVDEHKVAIDGVARDLEADELQGLPEERPDTGAADAALAVADTTAREANEHRTLAAAASEEIRGLAGEHRKLIQVHAQALADADTWTTVADRCDGRTPPKVSLQRWVLSAYLEEICVFANKRLGSMTGGRYRLSVHRDREWGGGKAGLGLRVHDTYTGQDREVSTLSGGETFQASLALALGVADVVATHAGGVRLDTLFVDEGFGTLDSEALQLAMNELDRLREGGRAVGLISHVGGLRERIRLGIEVYPGYRGSTLRVSSVSPI